MSQAMLRSSVFFRIASLVMILVAVALLAAVTTMHFAIHGAEVQVPSLKGMTVAEARSQTTGLGLNLDVDNRYYSSDVAAGTHPFAIARAGHGCAARMESARSREPRPAEGGSARHSRRGRARCGVAFAARRTRGRRHRKATVWRSARWSRARTGSASTCARHRTAQREPARCRARRCRSRWFRNARHDRNSNRNRAGHSLQSRSQGPPSHIRRCTNSTRGHGRCATQSLRSLREP